MRISRILRPHGIDLFFGVAADDVVLFAVQISGLEPNRAEPCGVFVTLHYLFQSRTKFVGIRLAVSVFLSQIDILRQQVVDSLTGIRRSHLLAIEVEPCLVIKRHVLQVLHQAALRLVQSHEVHMQATQSRVDV